MTTKISIIEFTRRIASEYKPERIVLFGSYFRGNPTPDSDVDLLIVMRFRGHPATQAAEMRLRLRPPFPVDLVVRTPGKVRERLRMGDSFIREAMKGRVLYETAHA